MKRKQCREMGRQRKKEKQKTVQRTWEGENEIPSTRELKNERMKRKLCREMGRERKKEKQKPSK